MASTHTHQVSIYIRWVPLSTIKEAGVKGDITYSIRRSIPLHERNESIVETSLLRKTAFVVSRSDSRKKREYDSCAGSGCGSGEDDGDDGDGDDDSDEDGEGDGEGEGNMMAILWPELGRGMPHILK